MKTNKRLEYNKKILKLLNYIVDNNPHLRLNQILTWSSLNTLSDHGDDGFYEEPWDTLKRINPQLRRFFDTGDSE